jgi:hypothetical protein
MCPSCAFPPSPCAFIRAAGQSEIAAAQITDISNRFFMKASTLLRWAGMLGPLRGYSNNVDYLLSVAHDMSGGISK